MSNRLGKRRFKLVYGADASRSDFNRLPSDPVSYGHNISMECIGYDHNCEDLVCRKKGSAKAKHSDKLARYEDMAYGYCYGRKKQKLIAFKIMESR